MDDRRTARQAALGRLVESRSAFAEDVAARYASGSRLARRDSDHLEQIARLIVGMVDTIEREFDRLDAARDLCAYRGPAGVHIERSRWSRGETAMSFAEALDPALNPAACAVLAAAVRLETA